MPGLSVRAVARGCLNLTGSVSVRHDLFIRAIGPAVSLKSELRFIVGTRCNVAESPLARGRYAVGRRTVQVAVPVGSVKAIVYYPAAESGANKPFGDGPEGPPFPLVAVAHAIRGNTFQFPVCPGAPTDLTQDYLQLSTILEHLANWGYVAVSSDQSGAQILDGKVPILEASITHMLAENGRANSPFKGQIRTSEIVLLGHSAGGGAALEVAAEQVFPIVAVCLLAPGGRERAAADAGAPLLVVHGTEEGGAGVPLNQPKQLYDAAPSPKHLVRIEGANHFGFTDALCLEIGDPAARIPRAHQQRVAYAYLTAFLQRYVRSVRGNDKYLSGDLPIEELESDGIVVESDT